MNSALRELLNGRSSARLGAEFFLLAETVREAATMASTTSDLTTQELKQFRFNQSRRAVGDFIRTDNGVHAWRVYKMALGGRCGDPRPHPGVFR